MGEQVVFRGYVKDMPSLYAECDLLVQSSFTEGLPNVVLEAAFLRLPIVATAVGGTAEVISHGHSGWLLRPTVDEIRNGIEAFLLDPGTFRVMAEAAHLKIVRDYSFSARTERIMALYEDVMGRTKW